MNTASTPEGRRAASRRTARWWFAPIAAIAALLPWGLFSKALSDTGRSMLSNRNITWTMESLVRSFEWSREEMAGKKVETKPARQTRPIRVSDVDNLGFG